MMPKFRAFIKLENAVNPMQTVAKINFEKESVTIEQGLVFKFNDVILMQYTGLKDKNGLDIYEGDIVEIKQQGSIVKYIPNNSVNEIVYKDSAFCVKETWGIGGIEWPIIAGLYYKASEEFEVLGNVHENPELLEVAE